MEHRYDIFFQWESNFFLIIRLNKLPHQNIYYFASYSFKAMQQDHPTLTTQKPEFFPLNKLYTSAQPSKCSYCEKQQSYTWSFVKEKVQPYTYQLLMESGWRRCGDYYYKPDLFKTCCKMYTHKLDVTKFKIKKDQKKAIKRVIALAYECVGIEQQVQQKDIKKSKIQAEKVKVTSLVSEIYSKMMMEAVSKAVEVLKFEMVNLIKKQDLDQKGRLGFNFSVIDKLKFFTSKPEDKSDYYCNFVMLLYGVNKRLFINPKYTNVEFAKDLKHILESIDYSENYKVTIERSGYFVLTLSPKMKSQKSQQFQVIQFVEPKPLHQKMEQQKPAEVTKSDKGFFNNLMSKITGENSSNEILKDPKSHKQNSNNYDKVKPQYKGEINISSQKITFGKIQIHVIKAEEKEESFKLYQSYGKKIHEKPEKSMSSYANFLCMRSIEFESCTSSKAGTEKKYVPSWDSMQKYQAAKDIPGEVKKLMGCYHMKYFLEGSLIAIGVVDIVPEGLSSVYFFYDPKFKDYRLGVFSSLIEIQYVRYLQLTFPEFKKYYMGFYIQDCEKMKYKADYSPCELLCPATFNFVQFTEEVKMHIQDVIDKKSINPRISEKHENLNQNFNFGNSIGPYIDKHLKLMYNGKVLVLKEINPTFFVHILKILKEHLPVWGKQLFHIFTFTL